ncbi:hypothetical protein [Sphingomonas sp. SRS2]|uniref:hypothetical protein n=1 Tax=Sphingomonas sp. SRS2 TaxID=133190 RepID=UPI00128B81EA|nr:hypothetical protein [Sphingomonas sp. SRS2]
MRNFICTIAASLLVLGSPAWSQAASTHTSSSTKVTTSNGKITSATASKKTAACRNEKGVFIKCASVVKTSAAATIVKDVDGKCRYAAGPKKGQFAKCP